MALTQTDRAPNDATTSPTPAQGKDAFLRTVVERFARVETAESVNRRDAVDDLKFRAGSQWPEDVKASRTIDRRPCLTINKVNTFVHQITNEQRQNRPSINVSPVGDRADPQTAQMLKGLIRQIERQSHADVAYDSGFESAVTIGWGYWRITTEYENEKSFNQVIKIDRIRNPFRVYLDPDRQTTTAADAQWGFITDMVPREEFKREHPKAEYVEWQEIATGDVTKWSTLTHIRVAEYFQYELKKRRLLALESGHIGYYDELNPQIASAVDAGTMGIVKEREVDAKVCVWYKLTAHDILDSYEWPSKWQPIVEVRGNEYDIEGKIELQGLVRAMKDPQRMYNYWCTAETEEVALRPKAPWLIEEGQIEGHEKEWREANTKNMPFLTYRNTSVGGKPTPMPQRQTFQGVPAAHVQAKIGAAQDMQAVTGVRWDATMQERMHDESGRALRELKRVGDIGNFHYVDNLARSLRHTGAILIDLIPKIYDTPRILTILREDGEEEKVKIDPGLPSAYDKRDENGNVTKLFNPKVGEYEVAVTIGPNFDTKRQEAADSMLSFMQAVPNSAPYIADLIAKNMDWPGAEEISSRLQTLLPPHMLDEKMKDLPPEARGIISSLTQQMAQLKQQHDQAVAMLGDKDKDRAVDIEKITKDYDAKITGIYATFEAKMMELMAANKQEDSGAEYAKIEADLQAKMAKIEADSQAKYAELLQEAEFTMAQMQLEDRARSREQAGKERESEGKLKLQEEANAAKAQDAQANTKIKAESAKAEGKEEEKPKPKKRTGKITGPSGRVYQLEVTEE